MKPELVWARVKVDFTPMPFFSFGLPFKKNERVPGAPEQHEKTEPRTPPRAEAEETRSARVGLLPGLQTPLAQLRSRKAAMVQNGELDDMDRNADGRPPEKKTFGCWGWGFSDLFGPVVVVLQDIVGSQRPPGPNLSTNVLVRTPFGNPFA